MHMIVKFIDILACFLQNSYFWIFAFLLSICDEREDLFLVYCWDIYQIFFS